MSTDTHILPDVEQEVTEPDVEQEVTEPDGKAHYVRVTALIEGGVVTALCGKRYVPTVIAEAGDREICSKCAELYAFLESLSS